MPLMFHVGMSQALEKKNEKDGRIFDTK